MAKKMRKYYYLQPTMVLSVNTIIKYRGKSTFFSHVFLLDLLFSCSFIGQVTGVQHIFYRKAGVEGHLLPFIQHFFLWSKNKIESIRKVFLKSKNVDVRDSIVPLGFPKRGGTDRRIFRKEFDCV